MADEDEHSDEADDRNAAQAIARAKRVNWPQGMKPAVRVVRRADGRDGLCNARPCVHAADFGTPIVALNIGRIEIRVCEEHARELWTQLDAILRKGKR